MRDNVGKVLAPFNDFAGLHLWVLEKGHDLKGNTQTRKQITSRIKQAHLNIHHSQMFCYYTTTVAYLF